MSYSENIEVGTDTLLDDVGKRMRIRRRQLKITLKELSAKSKVPLSTLSKVETGHMSLNIQKLMNVCAALNLDVMNLVSPPLSHPVVTGRRCITRSADLRPTKRQGGIFYAHAMDFSNRKMLPSIVELEAGVDSAFTQPFTQHRGEVFIYVLSGNIEVLSEFYAPMNLGQGESIYLDATMSHKMRLSGDGQAKVMHVVTDAEELIDQLA